MFLISILQRNKPIADSLRAIKIVNASKIQALAILDILRGKNNKVIISSNGTGKTLLYAIAIVSHVDIRNDGLQILCICATFEAAVQVYDVLEQVAMLTPVKIGRAVKDSHSKFPNLI